MIISEKGSVKLEGAENELMADAMCMLGAIYRMLEDAHGEEFAKERVASLGKMVVEHEEHRKLVQGDGDVKVERMN